MSGAVEARGPIHRKEARWSGFRIYSIRAATGFLALGLCASSGWAKGTTTLKSSPLNLSGQAVNPFKSSHPAPSVFIFIRTDCPISNRYAPEIQRIEREFVPRGVVFWLVDPDPTESAATLRRYLKQYGYTDAVHVLRDPSHVLVAETGVQVTPEVAVYSDDGKMAYRGRIDNWYVRLGRYRPAATTHDLQAAISSLLAGKPVAEKTTQAFGCFIADMQ
jgi:hypothetical protein